MKLAALDAATSAHGSPEDMDVTIAWRIKEGVWLAEKRSLTNALSELGGAPSMGRMIAEVRHQTSTQDLELQRREIEAMFQEREDTVVRDAVATTEERMMQRAAGEMELCRIQFQDQLRQAQEAALLERHVSEEKTGLVRELQAEIASLQDQHSVEIGKIKARTERALERALATGAEEAEKAWEEERQGLLLQIRALQEETERRWAVEEAFTEAKRNNRPVMELLYEKQALSLIHI